MKTMVMGIGEVLYEASKLDTREEKIAYLKKYDNVPLRVVLKTAIDPMVEFDLSPGTEFYRPSIYPDSHGMMLQRIPQYLKFLVGNAPELSRRKKDDLFWQMVETVHAQDAEVIVAAKQKQLPWGITKDLIEEAYGPL